MRGRARVRKGESAGGETCPCGGEGSLLAMRPVHAGEGERGERESAGGETCPMRGRAGVGRGIGKRTLSRTHGRKRLGGAMERGVCW